MAYFIARSFLIGCFLILLADGFGYLAVSQQSSILPADIDVSKAQALILKGDVAEHAGNKEEAFRSYREAAGIYQQAASRNPGNAGLWRKLGYYYLLGEQKDQSTAAFKEAIRLQPDDADSHRMLSIMQKPSDTVKKGTEVRGQAAMKKAEKNVRDKVAAIDEENESQLAAHGLRTDPDSRQNRNNKVTEAIFRDLRYLEDLNRKDMSVVFAINKFASNFDLRSLKMAIKNNADLLMREEVKHYLNKDAKTLLEGMSAIQRDK